MSFTEFPTTFLKFMSPGKLLVSTRLEGLGDHLIGGLLMLLPHFFVADMELQPLGATKHIQTCVIFHGTGEDVRFVNEMHEILHDVISS